MNLDVKISVEQMDMQNAKRVSVAYNCYNHGYRNLAYIYSDAALMSGLGSPDSFATPFTDMIMKDGLGCFDCYQAAVKIHWVMAGQKKKSFYKYTDFYKYADTKNMFSILDDLNDYSQSELWVNDRYNNPCATIPPPSPPETGLFAKAALAGAAKHLPGASLATKYPCDCFSDEYTEELMYVVIHLNDTHRWTREQIADWLDSVDDPFGDGPDLAFKMPESEEK